MTCATIAGDLLERVQSSNEILLVEVEVIEDGAVVDPTAMTAEASVVPAGSSPDTYVSCTWDENIYTDPITYSVEVEIGPGSAIGQLDLGDHWVYVRIGSTPGPVVLLSPTTLRIV